MLAAELWDGFFEVPRDYAISDDEVHVWLARIGLPAKHILMLANILSREEQQKAERFHFQVDRERHVVGRALVRIAIGRLLDRRPDNLDFRYNDFGKPCLADDVNERGLQFNVSHSGELILVALSANRRIGVDVERVRKDLNIDGIAERFFSSREQADLAALPVDLRHDAFFRCWSQKEAFIKARGEGLSLPLDSFDVTLRPTEPPALLETRPDPVEASRWVIRNLDVGPDHKAALAVEGAGWRLETMQWPTGSSSFSRSS
jgi:4'-phosphopantetheinyl transferase